MMIIIQAFFRGGYKGVYNPPKGGYNPPWGGYPPLIYIPSSLKGPVSCNALLTSPASRKADQLREPLSQTLMPCWRDAAA